MNFFYQNQCHASEYHPSIKWCAFRQLFSRTLLLNVTKFLSTYTQQHQIFLNGPSHLIATNGLYFFVRTIQYRLSELSFNLFTVSTLCHHVPLFLWVLLLLPESLRTPVLSLTTRYMELNDTSVQQLKFCNQAPCITTIFLQLNFFKQFAKAPVHQRATFYIHFKDLLVLSVLYV